MITDLPALGDLHNEHHVGVVVVVGAAGHVHHLVRHADVLGVGAHVVRRGHHHEGDRALVLRFKAGCRVSGGLVCIIYNKSERGVGCREFGWVGVY